MRGNFMLQHQENLFKGLVWNAKLTETEVFSILLGN